MSVVNSAQNLRFVGLYPRRGAFRAAFTSQDILDEIVFCQRKAWLHAIENDTDCGAVGLSKNGDAEFSAKRIHSFKYLRFNACQARKQLLKIRERFRNTFFVIYQHR